MKFISPDSGLVLNNEPHIILLDYLYDNWLTSPHADHPNLPLKSEIGFGYHWSERQRANKSMTLRCVPEPEIVNKFLTPRTHDYHQRVWVDFYVRVLDTEYDTTVPYNSQDKLISIRDFVRVKIEENHQGLASQGIHNMWYERYSEIPNPDEANIFHGIVYVGLYYRLRGV